MTDPEIVIPTDDNIGTACREVLAGIIPVQRLNLVLALNQLTNDHFPDPDLRLMFQILRKYYERTGEVLSQAKMHVIVSSSSWGAARQLAMEELYQSLAAQDVPKAEFKWSLGMVKDLMVQRLTGEAIVESMQILEDGVEVTQDNRTKFPSHAAGEVLRGAEESRNYLLGQLHLIERMGESESSPEGDIRLDRDLAIADYVARRDQTEPFGILTGLECIDSATGGFQNGELALLVAYTGQGKSMLVTQTAWHNSFGQCQDGKTQGRDIFFATSETIRPQVMRRIHARHSRLPQFEMPGGINSKDIKDGTLTPEGEKVLKNVVEDMFYNPLYGGLNVVQIPRGATLTWVEQRLREYGREVDVALAVCDYLALIRPTVRRQTRREEFDEIINDAKLIATAFGDGRGVPFLSPWAVNQTKYQEARQKGAYGLASLAETSVAEKSSDQIIAMLREEENTTEAALQFLKVRDGDLPAKVLVEIDFRSTYLGDRTGSTKAYQIGTGFTGADYGDLLN